MTTKRWRKEDAALLLAMKRQKVSRRKIAKHFGVTIHACDMKVVRLRAAAKAAANGERPKRQPAGQSRPERRTQPAPVRWSQAENDELVRRADAGEPFESIGADLGRTRWACKVHYHAIKRGTAATIDAPPVGKKATQRQEAAAAARHARESAQQHQTLTAELFGDPLPGRSALDRLRAGIVDEPDVDRRPVHRPVAPITLATEPMR
jgi:hypothetical protein